MHLTSFLQYVIYLLLIFIAGEIQGQYGKQIRTARPGQAIGAYSLGKNVIQVQSGLNIGTNSDEDSEINNHKFITVLRMGITEKIEVSGVIIHQSIDEKRMGNVFNSRGISNTQVGARINLNEGGNGLPVLGLQGRLLLKAQSEEYQRENIGSKFILATGNKINENTVLITNWGVSWEGNNQDPFASYAIKLNSLLTNRFGYFLEVYGAISNFQKNINGGIFFRLSPDLQADVSIGRINNELKLKFIDVGISWRANWRASM